MSEGEIWRDITGYEGLYKVSDRGNIYSVRRLNSRGNKCGGRVLTPTYNENGYLIVGLCKNGIKKSKRVHRLVAEAFVPNHNSYLEINHKDENKINNHVKNLEWCTREHNVNHGKRNKKVSQKLSKKVKAVNVETGEVITFNSTREAGNKGYDKGNISRASRGVYYGGNLYKGHRWYYIEEENK